MQPNRNFVTTSRVLRNQKKQDCVTASGKPMKTHEKVAVISKVQKSRYESKPMNVKVGKRIAIEAFFEASAYDTHNAKKTATFEHVKAVAGVGLFVTVTEVNTMPDLVSAKVKVLKNRKKPTIVLKFRNKLTAIAGSTKPTIADDMAEPTTLDNMKKPILDTTMAEPVSGPSTPEPAAAYIKTEADISNTNVQRAGGTKSFTAINAMPVSADPTVASQTESGTAIKPKGLDQPTTPALVPITIPGSVAQIPDGALSTDEHFKLEQPKPLGVKLYTKKDKTGFVWKPFPKSTNFRWTRKDHIDRVNRWRQQWVRRINVKLGIKGDMRKKYAAQRSAED